MSLAVVEIDTLSDDVSRRLENRFERSRDRAKGSILTSCSPRSAESPVKMPTGSDVRALLFFDVCVARWGQNTRRRMRNMKTMCERHAEQQGETRQNELVQLLLAHTT